MDLHNHTTRCGHASGDMEAYVRRAMEIGIRDFGFSDHSHWMLHDTGKRYAMQADELDEYVADVRHLQDRFNGEGPQAFAIRLGMEMDFIPSRLDEARAVQRRYDWDYIIGSVHNIGFEKLQEPELYRNWRSEDVCELYFHQLGMMLRERFCDIIGHLDLPKKMGTRPDGGLLQYVEPLIPEIRASGVAVEINTSGFDSPAGEYLPGWDVVKRLAEAGVPLTLGSDAHAPQQVGRYFNDVLEGLARLGVRELVRFEKRRMLAVGLDSIRSAIAP
jgi:histidinol-phosphatase (PHP family)